MIQFARSREISIVIARRPPINALGTLGSVGALGTKEWRSETPECAECSELHPPVDTQSRPSEVELRALKAARAVTSFAHAVDLGSLIEHASQALGVDRTAVTASRVPIIGILGDEKVHHLFA